MEFQTDAQTRITDSSTAAEDNMNVQMENINVTQRDGRVTHLDRVYIRGSHVRLFIVPDMLRYITQLDGWIRSLTFC